MTQRTRPTVPTLRTRVSNNAKEGIVTDLEEAFFADFLLMVLATSDYAVMRNYQSTGGYDRL